MASINATTSSGIVATADNTGTLQLQSAGTTSATFNSFGIGLGSATPSSGIGITFPAAQSASSDANTLDDYEEGTWTPTIGGGATFTSTGNYTKVGRMVAVNVYVDCSNWGSLSGTLTITGLPFVIGSSVSVGAGREDFATGAMIEMLAIATSSNINCLLYNNTSVIPGGANRRIIVGSVTYFV